MILRIYAASAAMLLAIPCAFLLVPMANIRSAPKVQKSQAKQFPWQGQTLPLTSGFDPDEGDERNVNWPDFSRLLHTRDLHVYTWDAAPEFVGKEENRVRNWLVTAGYSFEEVAWNRDHRGFRARRSTEILVALWDENNLYWGHRVPATPARKLDDALAAAISEGAPAKVQALLRRGANPRATDYVGASMLVRAVESDSAESLRLLLEAQGATRNQAPEFGEALDLAAENDNAAAVAVFLKMGANSAQIGAALQATATRGAEKSARLLVSQAPLPNVEATLITASYVDDWRGDTVQYPSIVSLMLTRKPSQSALNQALARVCDADNAGIMEILLAGGADPNAIRDGKPVLLWAVCSHRNYTVEPLLRHGANPNAQTATGETALMAAASSYNSMSRDVKDLLQSGADVKLRDNKGQTALDIARASIAHAARNAWMQDLQEIAQLLEVAAQTKPK